MKSNFFYNFFAFSLVVLSCFLYFRGHIAKIIYPDVFLFFCTDFGQYVLEVQEYLKEGTYFIDLVKVGEDPGLFIVASNLWRIAGIPSQSILTILSMIMYSLLGLCLYLLGRRLSVKNRNIAGIFCLVLYISLYSAVVSQLSGIWRQIIGHLLFLVFLLFSYYKNNKSILVGSILLAMTFLSHRIFTIINLFTFALIFLYYLFANKTKIKRHILVFTIALLFCLPYFILYLEYVLHVLEYRVSLQTGWPQTRGDFVMQMLPRSLGYSFFWTYDDRGSLLHYLFYQSWILIASIAYSRYSLRKVNKVYLFCLFVVSVYVSYKFTFSIRMLLFFEIILIPIAALNFVHFYNKYCKIFILICIFTLGLSIMSSKAINRPQWVYFDDWVHFLTNYVNKNEPHFIMGSVCASDLLSQIWLTNNFNYHMTLHNIKQRKEAWELDTFDLSTIVGENIKFLKYNWVLFDFFQDKKIYIVFVRNDTHEVRSIRQGTSGLLWKEYLTLVYPQNVDTPWVWIIKYVFEVNTELIQYADTWKHIRENVKSFNLWIDM